jgi:DNA repair exonuclease SbcCD ATPase subunit
MPEAESRLKNLEVDLEQIEREIDVIEEDLRNTQVRYNQELSHLTKAIDEKRHLIEEEETAMGVIATDTEKSTKEFGEKYEEILVNTEKEKQAIEKYEAEANAIDEAAKVAAAESDKAKADMEQEIAELEEWIRQTAEILKDPEAIRKYVPPNLPFLGDTSEQDPIFLLDQVAAAAHADGAKSKKGAKAKGKKKNKKK